ncbi:MAG: Rieske (2Fe-2S) protein, partial [Planctomycetes bacterium]|nr:Rieske (2Fe-2S) protein [Planctomycetota bacterium]
MTGTGEARWVALDELEGCAAGEMRTVKRDGHQIVAGRDGEGRPFALDNRCPHEGYPLAQGELKGTSLTCCWHNWKFDVKSGACTLGGEAVRHYPTREFAGRVEVDLSDPDPRSLWPGLLESFEEGLWKHELGRALRDGVRLLQAGYDVRRLAIDVARIDARYAEYGSGHALPVAADCLRLTAGLEGPHRLEAVALAMDMASESIARLPRRELAAPIAGATAQELRAAVEAEEGACAEGLLLGAIDAGVPREEVDAWMYALLADHFLNFGHQLIFLVKAQELLAGDDDRDAWREIYAAMLHGIVTGTREDTLPYWAGHQSRLAALDPELVELASREARATDFCGVSFRAAVLDGSAAEAFRAVESALRAGVDPEQVARALVVAAAERFMRFDPAVDSDPELAETWLWVTHRFTHAAAVRHAVLRWNDPRRWRLLFHSAAFVNLGRPMDGAGALPEAAGDGSAASVMDAIARHDADGAVAAARAFLASGAPLEELESPLHELLRSDPLVRPIFVAHAVKTLLAALEEHRALAGEDGADLPLLAGLRFLASPHTERR